MRFAIATFITDEGIRPGRPGVPVPVFGLGDREPDALAGHAEAGVGEVALFLPTLPDADTLRTLDDLATPAGSAG
jgi:hypothetical protein